VAHLALEVALPVEIEAQAERRLFLDLRKRDIIEQRVVIRAGVAGAMLDLGLADLHVTAQELTTPFTYELAVPDLFKRALEDVPDGKLAALVAAGAHLAIRLEDQGGERHQAKALG
jgi:hypothetical protein